MARLWYLDPADGRYYPVSTGGASVELTITVDGSGAPVQLPHPFARRFVAVHVYDQAGYEVEALVQCIDEVTVEITLENAPAGDYTVVVG